jgi:hypothetical protein
LVRGKPGDFGPNWQVLKPDLDEIVLTYLSVQRDSSDLTPSAEPISTEDGAS